MTGSRGSFDTVRNLTGGSFTIIRVTASTWCRGIDRLCLYRFVMTINEGWSNLFLGKGALGRFVRGLTCVQISFTAYR